MTAPVDGPRVRLVSRKGTPPTSGEVLHALDVPAPKRKKPVQAVAPKPPKKRSERTKALNFTVTPNFRKAFKLAAEAQSCKKVELLELIFAEWQDRHPV